MAVLIKNSQRSITVDSKSVKKLTKELLTFSGLQGRDISILLINNRQITTLNKRFFRKQQPTNVISFSYIGGLPGEIAGEIIISVEKTREEAERSGVHFYERLFALIIHGLLHITGYDHVGEKKQCRRMRYREKKLLGFIVSHDVYRQMASGRTAR